MMGAAKEALKPVPEPSADSPVLVADDDATVRTMLRTLLELDGHRVLEAPDGEVAWKLITAHQPSVVVADIQMPGLTGLQLCRKVKQGGFSVRIIVYTAGMATEDESRKAGCDAYFLKTDPLPRLREAVRRLHSLGSA